MRQEGVNYIDKCEQVGTRRGCAFPWRRSARRRAACGRPEARGRQAVVVALSSLASGRGAAARASDCRAASAPAVGWPHLRRAGGAAVARPGNLRGPAPRAFAAGCTRRRCGVARGSRAAHPRAQRTSRLSRTARPPRTTPSSQPSAPTPALPQLTKRYEAIVRVCQWQAGENQRPRNVAGIMDKEKDIKAELAAEGAAA